MTSKIYVSDEEALDERGRLRPGYGVGGDRRLFRIVPDGGRVDVPLMMTDSSTRSPGERRGHRPGFVEDGSHTLDDLQRRAADAYERSVRRQADAWRSGATPPHANAGHAMPGSDASLGSASDNTKLDDASIEEAQARADEAWERSRQRDANAWRGR
jgi:hypothetical protein